MEMAGTRSNPDPAWNDQQAVAWRASVSALSQHCWAVLQNFHEANEAAGMKGYDTLQEVYNLLNSLEQELE